MRVKVVLNLPVCAVTRKSSSWLLFTKQSQLKSGETELDLLMPNVTLTRSQSHMVFGNDSRNLKFIFCMFRRKMFYVEIGGVCLISS